MTKPQRQKPTTSKAEGSTIPGLHGTYSLAGKLGKGCYHEDGVESQTNQILHLLQCLSTGQTSSHLEITQVENFGRLGLAMPVTTSSSLLACGSSLILSFKIAAPHLAG